VAYVRITQFTSDTADNLRDAITPLLNGGMQGLILDLRFNPGGRLEEAKKVVDLFVSKGVIVSTRGRARPEQQFTATGAGTLPYFPMIVLVNEHSASASEIVAGSLKDNHRAVVVGTRSYGKGSVQEVIPLDSKGGELKLTVAYYYLPSGRLVHRKKDATDWGVEPNISVPMDDAAQKKMVEERYEAELFKKPIAKATTSPATAPSARASGGPTTEPADMRLGPTPAGMAASGTPATQPADIQLQRAVDTLVALLVLENDRTENSVGAGPSQRAPTSQPATAPVGAAAP
jgi:C-terminal processing protease CtpA/Prc